MGSLLPGHTVVRCLRMYYLLSPLCFIYSLCLISKMDKKLRLILNLFFSIKFSVFLVCKLPRSYGQFVLVLRHIKWVKTFWTYSTHSFLNNCSLYKREKYIEIQTNKFKMSLAFLSILDADSFSAVQESQHISLFPTIILFG